MNSTARPEPLPGLADIAPYVPGKGEAGDRKVYKLSSNESALGPSVSAMVAARESAAGLHIYPDSAAYDLKTAIAEVHELDPSQLIIGSGSDEVLQLLMRAYAGPGDKILQSAHGFSYYKVAAAAVRVETISAPEKNFTSDVEGLIRAVTPDTKLLFLANPNNPTGTVLMADELRALREQLPSHIMLVIDGAYAEYMDDPAYSDGRDLVDDAIASGANNVVMTRTFSKIYGLGGARVGWGYGPQEVISILERIRPPFNISVPGLKAAEAAIRDQDFVEENRAFTLKERARLADALVSRGLSVIPSTANFVTFELSDAGAAKALLGHLENDGILIRSAASSGLPCHLRVSIGPKEATDAFLVSLDSYLH